VRFQLRDYRVKPGEMRQWLAEWSAQIRPLREKFGFQVVSAWAIPDQDRFIWILAREDFESADRQYYESAERHALDPNPARHLAATDQQFIDPV
jgi:hypothetical protein